MYLVCFAPQRTNIAGWIWLVYYVALVFWPSNLKCSSLAKRAASYDVMDVAALCHISRGLTPSVLNFLLKFAHDPDCILGVFQSCRVATR